MAYIEIKQHGTQAFPFELYHIDKDHPKYEMAYHWHREIEVVRVLSGKLEIKLDRRTYLANPGDIIFINSEVIHSAIPQKCLYQCIVFDPDFFATYPEAESFISNLTGKDAFINEYFPKKDSNIHRLVNMFFEEMVAKNPGYRFTVTGIVMEIFGEIIKKGYLEERLNTKSENAKNIHKLKRVLKFIRGSYGKQITLDDMSRAAGVSPKYFCSFFKEMTSKTPFAYLNNYRIEKACHKLTTTDASVTDVAYDCGFNDLSYFIKVFKEERGITPKQFRINTSKK